VHDAAIRGGIGRRWANSARAMAPNLLELGRRHISAVISGDGGPELLAASLINSAKAVSVDDLGLMNHLGVDAEGVVRLRRLARGKGARLGEQDLVLVTARGSGDRGSPEVRAATSVAHGRAVTR
jgi:hypothetical protein